MFPWEFFAPARAFSSCTKKQDKFYQNKIKLRAFIFFQKLCLMHHDLPLLKTFHSI